MYRDNGFETGSNSGMLIFLLATTQNEDKQNAEGRAELQANEAKRSWLPEKLQEANYP
jgi:hypothetical protein